MPTSRSSAALAAPLLVTPINGSRLQCLPEEYVIPATYRVTDDGVCRRTTERGRPTEIPVCSMPLWIEAFYSTSDNEDMRVLLAARVGERVVRRPVPLTDVNRATRLPSLAALGFLGFTSECARETVAYIGAAITANLSRLKHHVTVRHAGPEYDADGLLTAFVHGGMRRTAEGSVAVELATDDDSARRTWKAYAARGDSREWGRLWLRLRSCQLETPITAIAFAGASLMNSILDLMPTVLSIAGDAGGGKTVTVRLAASTAGNPDVTVRPMRATENGMEAVLAAAGAMPLCLDETSSFSAGRDTARALEQFVYMVTEREGKSRMSRNTTLRSAHRWSCSVLVSGETDLGSVSAQSGVRRRVLTLFGAPFGYDPDRSLIQYVQATIAHSHGHVAQLIAGRLLKLDHEGLSALRRHHEARVRRWLEDMPRGTDHGMITAYARTMAAAELVAEWIDEEWPIGTFTEIHGRTVAPTRDLLERAWRHMTARLDSARRPENLLDVIREYYAQNMHRFEGTPARLQLGASPRDELLGKVDPRGQWVAFAKGPLAKHLKTMSLDLTTDLEHLDNAGALFKGGDGKRTLVTRFNGASVRMVAIRTSILHALDKSSDVAVGGVEADALQQVVDFLDGRG